MVQAGGGTVLSIVERRSLSGRGFCIWRCMHRMCRWSHPGALVQSRLLEHLPLQRRQALAMIAGDGTRVSGRVREKLHEQGVDRRTLIFFIGDNGPPLGTALGRFAE
ncbi:MAG UNVERIFIED_CONTAM: hypothetical protein LVR18_25030 [Planctomycetaceae bacterium]